MTKTYTLESDPWFDADKGIETTDDVLNCDSAWGLPAWERIAKIGI